MSVTEDISTTGTEQDNGELDASSRARAVRTVAAMAKDAQDCAELLAALGLDPQEARAA